MELFDAIDTRHTTRKFDSYQPTTDEIERIINSARMAPCAMNTQNWRFIAITNKYVKDKLANSVLLTYDEILEKLDDETKKKVERYKGHSTFFKNAPLVVICIEKRAIGFMEGVLEKAGYSEDDIKTMRPDSFLLSMGSAIQNMLLAGHALGLGSCWMVAPVLASYKMKDILKLNDSEKIVSIIAFGKQTEDSAEKRSVKKNIDEIMTIIS